MIKVLMAELVMFIVVFVVGLVKIFITVIVVRLLMMFIVVFVERHLRILIAYFPFVIIVLLMLLMIVMMSMMLEWGRLLLEVADKLMLILIILLLNMLLKSILWSLMTSPVRLFLTLQVSNRVILRRELMMVAHNHVVIRHIHLLRVFMVTVAIVSLI